MRKHLLARWSGAAIAAAGLVIALGAGPAQAASSPRWQPFYTSTQAGFSSITSTGPDAAWAVGTTRNGAPFLLEWNGTRWRSAEAPGGQGFVPYYVQATASNDVWVIGVGSTDAAYHWNGKSWHSVALPVPIYATVVSSTDVWGFGGSVPPCTVAKPATCRSRVWNWRNGVVSTYTVPGLVAEIVPAGGQVWVLDEQAIKNLDEPDETSLPAVYLGNATGLHKVAAPAGRIGVFPQIAASPAGHLWVLAPAASKGKPADLDYWNGHVWARRAIPRDLDYGSWSFVYDGHSGVWLGPYTHWTGSGWVATDPSGPTTSYELDYVTAIPGSASAWAFAFSGAHVGKHTYLGMIALLGHRP